jgi:predicted enzyme related to lactoylglutathione lyase
MLGDSKAFGSFAIDDLQRARQFYEETLGVETTVMDEEFGVMALNLAGDPDPILYVKPDYVPATFTVLNFPVDDIDAAVDELAGRGISFERYEGMPQDEKGVMREAGPLVAWFKDPAGNILSVMQER